MNSKELFEKACELAIQNEKNQELNLDNLMELGFIKIDLNETEKSLIRSPNLLYKIDCKCGNKIEVKAYSYDPTKSFSTIEPDINKIYIKSINESGEVLKNFHYYFSDPK